MYNTNQAFAGPIADMYRGKADALSTKDMIDSAAMSGFLKGGSDLLSAIKGDPNIADLVMQALLGGQGAAGGGTTTDGTSIWQLLSEGFGFDAEDPGMIESVLGILGVDNTNGPGTNEDGSINWGELGQTVGGALDLGDIGNIDWGNIFGDLATGTQGMFSDISFDDLFSDFGDTWTGIDWDNLFSWGSSDNNGENALGILDGAYWDDAGNIVMNDNNGLGAIDFSNIDLSGGSSWLDDIGSYFGDLGSDLWDWGADFFQ